MMLRANRAWTSVNESASAMPPMTECMSYDCFGESGTSASSAAPSTLGAGPLGPAGRQVDIVLWQVADQRSRQLQCLRLARREEVRDAARLVVDARAAQPLEIDLLVGHGLHDIRAGDEHVARALDHDDEVRDRRRIHRSAGARPHDERELRHDAGGQGVAQEDVGIAAEAHDALLDPRAARIREADDRRAVLHRKIHDLADLLGVRFGQGATEDREVLAVHKDKPIVDASVSGDDAIAEVSLLVDSEVGGAMRHECVDLGETVFVEQQLEALSRRELSARVLLIEPFRSPTRSRVLAHRRQSLELVGRRHATHSFGSFGGVGPAGIEPATVRL